MSAKATATNNLSVSYASRGSRRDTGKRIRLPLSRMRALQTAVMGPRYSLSLVIADSATSHRLNKAFRGKDKPTDILSFALADGPDGEGEIFLDLAECRKKAAAFERTFPNYLLFVFIHGLFHLKGFDHGSIMERKEAAVRKRFGV